jgi:hypothetical protein
MGNYDIPAMINKVLEVTGHEKLFYIGKNFMNILLLRLPFRAVLRNLGAGAQNF